MPVFVVVVMGVSGCGKSTVGKLLADKLRCDFVEGDSVHPASNVAKMASGVPLTDADRMPWLMSLHSEIKEHLATSRRLVVSCSALKPAYRRILLYGTPDEPRSAATAAPTVTSGAAAASPIHGCGPDAKRTEAHDYGDRPGPGGPVCTQQQDCGHPPSPPRAPPVAFVLLDPSPAELRRRLAQRELSGRHFMPARLLDSQLAALSYTEDELFAHIRGGGDDGRDDGGSGGGGEDCAGSDGSTGSGAEDNEFVGSCGGGAFPGADSIVDQLLQRLNA